MGNVMPTVKGGRMEICMDNVLLNTTKEKLNEIADILYKDKVNLGMSKMNQVIPDIAVIASNITDAELQQRLINDALTPALGAMENKDASLLADIITYELIEILDSMM